jgi:hypothetical protein
MTTTATQTAWGIVDHIIRVEIPDAVPGCEALRMIPSMSGHRRMLLVMPSVVSIVLGSLPMKMDSVGQVEHLCRLRNLVRDVMDMACNVSYVGLTRDDYGDDGSADCYLPRIRNTLAEIKAAT